MPLKKILFSNRFPEHFACLPLVGQKYIAYSCRKLTPLVEHFYVGLVGMIKQTECLDKATYIFGRKYDCLVKILSISSNIKTLKNDKKNINFIKCVSS